MDHLKAIQRMSRWMLSLGVLAFFLAGAGNALAQQGAGAGNAPAQQGAGAAKDPDSAEKKKCVPEDPVNCGTYGIDVQFLGDGAPGCIVNPGVSKKCNAAGLVTKCPFAYGPYTCKTVIYDTNHNCKCACQS